VPPAFRSPAHQAATSSSSSVMADGTHEHGLRRGGGISGVRNVMNRRMASASRLSVEGDDRSRALASDLVERRTHGDTVPTYFQNLRANAFPLSLWT
jgi:hypothetical protein